MTSKYGSFSSKKCGNFLLLSKSVFGYFKSKKREKKKEEKKCLWPLSLSGGG